MNTTEVRVGQVWSLPGYDSDMEITSVQFDFYTARYRTGYSVSGLTSGLLRSGKLICGGTTTPAVDGEWHVNGPEWLNGASCALCSRPVPKDLEEQHKRLGLTRAFVCDVCRAKGLVPVIEAPKLPPIAEAAAALRDFTSTHAMSPYLIRNALHCQDCGGDAAQVKGVACRKPGSRMGVSAVEREAAFGQLCADKFRRAMKRPLDDAELPEYRGLATGIGGVVCTFGRGLRRG